MTLKKENKFTEKILEGKGKLIVSKGLQEKIDYLHKRAGAVEWSGILLYKMLEGDIDDPSSIVISAEDVFLMDIGSHSYTSAEIEADDVIDIYDKVEKTGLKQGLIHTHNSMDRCLILS